MKRSAAPQPSSPGQRAVLLPLLAAAAVLGGCASAGIGIGVPILPGVSLGVGVGSGGNVQVGVGVNKVFRQQMKPAADGGVARIGQVFVFEQTVVGVKKGYPAGIVEHIGFARGIEYGPVKRSRRVAVFALQLGRRGGGG